MQAEDDAATRTRSRARIHRNAVPFDDLCFTEFAAPNDSANV
jgi:hypothetical protein